MSLIDTDRPSATGRAGAGRRRQTPSQVAGQWQLMWWKLPPAQAGRGVRARRARCIYLVAIFAEFLAPHRPDTLNAPLHLRAAAGASTSFARGRLALRAARLRLHDRASTRSRFAAHLRRSTRASRSRSASSCRARRTSCGASFPCDRHLFGPARPERSDLPARRRPARPRHALAASSTAPASRCRSGWSASRSALLLGIIARRHLRLSTAAGSTTVDPARDRVPPRRSRRSRSGWGWPRRCRTTWPPLQVYFVDHAHPLADRLDGARARGARPVPGAARARTSSPPRGSTARASGASSSATCCRRSPATSSPSLTLAIPAMILAETALSFLGLGLQPPVVSWGVLLQEAQNIRAVATAPWLLSPGARRRGRGARAQLPRRRPARRRRPLPAMRTDR